MVREQLIAAHGWDADAIILIPVVASGDRIQDRALAEVGGKALWTKELDTALLAGEIDLAVHSMKDVETVRPDALAIAAMLPRADVRDRLVGATSIDSLPQRARFGTSAPRRRAQVLRLRPDLEITLMRGNVQTRLAKLARGDVDATLLAAAGLDRLEMHDIGTAISAELLLPAPAQGAIGIEILTDNRCMHDWLGAINCGSTFSCVSSERALLSGLAGDCRSPVAALAVTEGNMISLRAKIYAPDGDHVECGEALFKPGSDSPAALGRSMLARAHSSIRAVFQA
jgi:hydroxymethylbilane synthase